MVFWRVILFLLMAACSGGGDDDGGGDDGGDDGVPAIDAAPIADAGQVPDPDAQTSGNFNCHLTMVADETAGVPPEAYDLNTSILFRVADEMFMDRIWASVICSVSVNANPYRTLAIRLQIMDRTWAQIAESLPISGDQNTPREEAIFRANYLYQPDGGAVWYWGCPNFDDQGQYSWEITEVIPHELEPPTDVNFWHVHGRMTASGCAQDGETPPAPGTVALEATF